MILVSFLTLGLRLMFRRQKPNKVTSVWYETTKIKRRMQRNAVGSDDGKVVYLFFVESCVLVLLPSNLQQSNT